MHAQRAYEVAFHHPERFGEEQRVGGLSRHPIDHLAPEFFREHRIKLVSGQTIFRARGNRAARARFREPQALIVLLRQRHGRIEADDGEVARHMQNSLNHRLAHFGFEIVQLRGIVPRKTGAIVAVIDVLGAARPLIDAFEDHGRVAVIEVVIFQVDSDAPIPRPIRSVEGVRREWRIIERDKPIGMFDHPVGIDPHVVGHHVARQPDTALARPFLQRDQRRVAAQIVGDAIVHQRISRGDRFGIAHHAFDVL